MHKLANYQKEFELDYVRPLEISSSLVDVNQWKQHEGFDIVDLSEEGNGNNDCNDPQTNLTHEFDWCIWKMTEKFNRFGVEFVYKIS